jgi:hypothetical protein
MMKTHILILLSIFVLSPFFLFSQTQIGNDIDGLAAEDHSGIVSISSDGTIVAIGTPGNDDAGDASGLVRIFENINDNWVQKGNTIYGEATGDLFGSSVSISGDGTIVAIGGPYNDNGALNGGQVKVFEYIGGTWTQIGDTIDGEIEVYRMGLFVSLSENGRIVAISGFWCCNIIEDMPSVGYTRIYENINDEWTLIGDISTGLLGISELSLSGDGSVVAIASPGGGVYGFANWYIGGVAVYRNEAGVWTQMGDPFYAEIIGCGNDWINGVSLSNDGYRMVYVGSHYTRVYDYINEVWVQHGEDIVRPDNNGAPIRISADGTILALGEGPTRLYEYISGSWTQIGSSIYGESSSDYFGYSLELSSEATTLIVGAPNNDGNGEDSGHARVYDLSAILLTVTIPFSQFSIFPNPAENHFTIQLDMDSELERINIYNNLGQLVHSTSKMTVDTSTFSSGLYYVEVITNKGKATEKLILQ